jgi:hypothetical protein
MCIRTTSAKQSDKSEIVCSTAYRILGEVTYLSLVLTFFAVSAFKNKHDNFLFVILRHPNPFSCLLVIIFVHRFETCVEDKVIQGAYRVI